MAILVDNIIPDINALSASVNTNELVTGARTSVVDGLKSFMITPKEKAQILANFEMQFTGAILEKIIDSTIQARISEAQIAVSMAEVALKDKELQLKDKEIEIAAMDLALKSKQLEVMEREITLKEALNAAQIANLNAETSLKGSQKNLVDQQKLTEVQNTIKVTREYELLAENKNLVMAQKATEEKRRLDVMAGINVKNEQALSARQSAKFEEARRHTLLASTMFNNQIQKSKEENATLNALALDADFVITDTHLLRVKAALDAIDTEPITYTSDITQSVKAVDYGT